MSATLSATQTQSLPQVRFLGRDLDMSESAFGLLRESNDILDDGDALRQRMAQEGYLFIRGLLDREEIMAARLDICRHMAARGLLDTSKPLINAVPIRKFEHGHFFVDFAQHLEAVNHALYAANGPVMNFYRTLFGKPVRHFDYTWFRTQIPNDGICPHADVVYMGRGTRQLYTAWIPMGDASLLKGGLTILENSKLAEPLLRDYLKTDVDSTCSNAAALNETDAPIRFRKTFGFLDTHPVDLRDKVGGRWLTADYQAGDFLTFHVPTMVHGVTDNQTDTYLLSTDSRYQPADEPADERWISVDGQPAPGHGGKMVKGMIC